MAINISQAKIIAEKYVIDLGEVMPGFTYGITEPEVLKHYFYFDFILLDLVRLKPQDPPSIGGAPGIVVAKDDGKVETISFSRLFALQNEDKESTSL